MILLLDTHVFLWWVNGEPIPSRAADLLSAREHDILFSAASAWEMTIKASIGKLALPEPVAGFVQKNLALNGFRWIGIEPAALSVLQDLKYHHRDPFDRLLISQAIALGCPLLSADPLFSSYPVECFWQRPAVRAHRPPLRDREPDRHLQQPFAEWDRIFPDQTMTVAAVDRLVHHATIIEVGSDSYRRKEALGQVAAGAATTSAPSATTTSPSAGVATGDACPGPALSG